MSIHNIGLYKEPMKVIFQLSSHTLLNYSSLRNSVTLILSIDLYFTWSKAKVMSERTEF